MTPLLAPAAEAALILRKLEELYDRAVEIFERRDTHAHGEAVRMMQATRPAIRDLKTRAARVRVFSPFIELAAYAMTTACSCTSAADEARDQVRQALDQAAKDLAAHGAT